MDAKARREKVYRDIEAGVIPAIAPKAKL